MGKSLSPTQLRAHLFQILDEVLDTGQPCEIVRGDRKLLIVPGGPVRRDFQALPRRQTFTCSPEELVATTWEYVPDPDLFPDRPAKGSFPAET